MPAKRKPAFSPEQEGFMQFSELGLCAPILRAAAEAGYTQPSPIQEKAIGPVLAGRDVLGCAQTGTGKTAAFAMPILDRLARSGTKGYIRALVLTPTRELALQIDESFAAYGCGLPLRHLVIFGGVGQGPQVAALHKGVDILTATPGRLNDLAAQGHIDLSRLEVFVLDEADRMLDMGFVHDVKRVVARLPQKRQTLLFSATMPAEIRALAQSLLHSPVYAQAAPPATTVEAIEQCVCFVDKGNKKHLLARLLREPEVDSALVFTRTKHGANRVVKELAAAGMEAMAIHGNKSQTARQQALGRFKAGELRVLVATDIAARGIDVSGLSHVFNYDLPNVPETYVHRIGRTGRAGKSGCAVSFCCEDELAYLADIEKLIKRTIPVRAHAWPAQFGAPVRGMQAAPGGQKTEQEKTVMEEKEKMLPGAPQSEGPAKRRRRRGGRRHNRGKKAAEAQAAAPVTPAAPAASKPGPAKAERKKETRPQPHTRREGAVRCQSAAPEVDDSIQLISRRPPAQKFSSFEEYMKAHGAAGPDSGEEGPSSQP